MFLAYMVRYLGRTFIRTHKNLRDSLVDAISFTYFGFKAKKHRNKSHHDRPVHP